MHRSYPFHTHTLALLWLGCTCATHQVHGQEVVDATLEKRTDTFRLSPPSSDPAGIIYLPTSNTLLVSDSEINEIDPIFTGGNLFELNIDGTLVRTQATLDFTDEPTGLAINTLNGHVFIADDDAKEITEVHPGPDGLIGTIDDALRSFDTISFGSGDPEDIAFDPLRHHLYIADGEAGAVFDIDPGPNGFFDGVASVGGDDLVTSFDVTGLGIVDPEGIEFDVASDTLLVIESISNGRISELTIDGTLIREIDISDADPNTPAGVTLAPGSVDTGSRHLYVVDRARDNQNDGRLYELSLPATSLPVITTFGPDRGTADLEVTIRGSNFATTTQVLFGSESAIFSVISGNEIRATVPGGASTDRIGVRNPQGLSHAPGIFFVLSPPSNIEPLPSHGGEGDWIRVVGSGLSGVQSVSFNDTAASEWTVDSEAQVRARVPVGASTGLVEVTSALGTASSTVTFAVLPTLIFHPSHDAHVRSNQVDANFGDDDGLRVKAGSSVYHTYLKFDLAGTFVVQSARLRLFATGQSFDGGSVFLVSNDFVGTDTPWDEATLTWNNAPTLDGNPVVQVGSTFLDRWKEIDITKSVTVDGVVSFGFSSVDPLGLFYSSKEGDQPPELIIVCGTSVDTDEDGVPDGADNCPLDANTDQADENDNGVGDVCEPEAVPFIRGDVNSDSIVDIVDPIFALFALFGNGAAPVPDCWKTVDANDDGVADTSDAIATLLFLFQSGPVVDAPFPECGPDPTADALPCESFPCP